MVELGMFEGERIELIEGRIVTMAAMGAPHIGAINRLNMLLAAALKGRAVVQVQGPLALGSSRPEPDLAVLALPDGPDALAETGHLAIEVADSSLAYDREVKIRMYGRHGFTEGWVVNLVEQQLEVHLRPSAVGFRERRLILPGERVALADFPDVELDVGEILGSDR